MKQLRETEEDAAVKLAATGARSKMPTPTRTMRARAGPT